MPKNKKKKMTALGYLALGLMIPTIITGATFGIVKLNEEPPAPVKEEVSFIVDEDDAYIVWSKNNDAVILDIDVRDDIEGLYVEDIELDYIKDGDEYKDLVVDMDDKRIDSIEDFVETIKEKYDFDGIQQKYFPEPKTEEGGF